MQGQIRWKKQDYLKLGKAVAGFNKKINQVKNIMNEDFLPQELSYQDLKSSIKTRAELNRTINSLRRFKKEGAEELYQTEAGEIMTLWERRELGIKSRAAQTRLKAELKKLNATEQSKYMGSERIREIEGSLRRLKTIEQRKFKDFEKLKKTIEVQGNASYKYRRASLWKQNYIDTMNKYKNLTNYDKLEKVFNKYTNPIRFYEFFSQDELGGDLTYQSDNTYTQQAFNSLLERLGIEINDIEEGYSREEGV